jgi:deoxyribose-phosphate aldolase
MAMACQMRGKVIKVILETGLMNEAELAKLCEMATEIKVDFVKTSTGVNGKGATVPIVEALRKKLPPAVKIKASGGIRDWKFAEELIAAGADRIGTSVATALVNS